MLIVVFNCVTFKIAGNASMLARYSKVENWPVFSLSHTHTGMVCDFFPVKWVLFPHENWHILNETRPWNAQFKTWKIILHVFVIRMTILAEKSNLKIPTWKGENRRGEEVHSSASHGSWGNILCLQENVFPRPSLVTIILQLGLCCLFCACPQYLLFDCPFPEH